MAEDLANAIVDAAEKMHKKTNISNAVETLALFPYIKITPLYECIQKIYRRNNDNRAYELCSIQTWYEFDETGACKDMFEAVSNILSIKNFEYNRRNRSVYEIEEDEELNNECIGLVFENMQIKKNETKEYVQKKVVALFRSKQDELER